MNSILSNLGWNDAFQRKFEALNDPSLFPGRVMRENRGQYLVDAGNGERTARLTGLLRQACSERQAYPTVGDWLVLQSIERSDDYLVRAVLERQSVFERQVAGAESKLQVLAANFDALFLVSGLDGDFNLHRIQRYLSLALSSGAETVVVLNKADLCEDVERAVAEVRAVAPGASVFSVSACNRESLSCLERYLGPGKTVALLGSSGVGKSTLINAFLGGARLRTQSNRNDDSRGRHTTTWREVILLPQGGALVDLPGMRELQLTGEEAGIRKAFTEIEALARSCRFRNCQHNGEPGCAVTGAIACGQLDPDRLEQYRKLTRESGEANRRSSERVRSMDSKQRRNYEKEQRMKEWARARKQLVQEKRKR